MILSMGYGFVQFMKSSSVDKALKVLQHKMLDDHCLELKRSSRASVDDNVQTSRKRGKEQKIEDATWFDPVSYDCWIVSRTLFHIISVIPAKLLSAMFHLRLTRKKSKTFSNHLASLKEFVFQRKSLVLTEDLPSLNFCQKKSPKEPSKHSVKAPICMVEDWYWNGLQRKIQLKV
jgi:hypothetical protein